MKQWLARRRLKKEAINALRQAHHVRNSREDLLPATVLLDLAQREAALKRALGTGEADTITITAEAVRDWVDRHAPRHRNPGIRENIEIFAVAIAIAMACRTYFIQPFKIPTGSMQPTLMGITYSPAPKTFMDRLPFKILKWSVTGQWYVEMKARVSGEITQDPRYSRMGNDDVTFYVANVLHRVPKDGFDGFSPGDFVTKGTVLWRGVRTAGDHVFVDKLRWNLMHPRRGQVTVFDTDNIPSLPDKIHYIKRLVGLPNEVVSISPPNLMINGEAALEPDGIRRIAEREDGQYLGYQLINWQTDGNPDDWGLRSENDRRELGAGEYFMLGDNTGNSRDGRYWGSVPQKNLVGPAVMVYWPFSSRWGRIQ